jgi:RNA recognition motif-containing protein
MAIGNDEAKLFVAGLPDSVSEELLRQIFEATGGKVVSVSLPKDRMTGRPRGFGFVTLSTPQEAEAARNQLDGSLQGGRSISVRPFQAEPPKKGEGPMSSGPRSSGSRSNNGQQTPDRTLYVGNLPYDCTQPEVEALINGAVGEGQVVRVHLPTDAEGRKRGFGFVTMASAEAAKNAAEQLKSADLRGRRLVVNIAHPKGERPPRNSNDNAPGPSSSNFGGYGGKYNDYGGHFGGPNFGPPPSRRTFDSDRRRKGGGGGDGDGFRRGRRNRQDSDYDDYDWRRGDRDDD